MEELRENVKNVKNVKNKKREDAFLFEMNRIYDKIYEYSMKGVSEIRISFKRKYCGSDGTPSTVRTKFKYFGKIRDELSKNNIKISEITSDEFSHVFIASWY